MMFLTRPWTLVTYLFLLNVILGASAEPLSTAVSTDSNSGKQGVLSLSDIVIVYTTTKDRLQLVHATRPARRGIRTFIAVEDEATAASLNTQFGGASGEHQETYVAWPDAAADASGGGGSGGGGLYGDNPPSTLHPLHRIGPRWAMAPLLAHELLIRPGSNGSATDAQPLDPPPYRWILAGRDDTLWLPYNAAQLLAPYDAGAAAAVSDHLLDFNGRDLLSPSPVPAVCLPCGLNLTALLGRRRPPRVPHPACPVCRPAEGCEFRFDWCVGMAGGRHCGTKKFLGSGDRCSHSWAAGGGGMALSAGLMANLERDSLAACLRTSGTSTGERALARCLWRTGFALTHPAAALAAGVTRNALSRAHMLFGNPVARKSVFGARADELLGPAYAAVEAEAKAAAATAASRRQLHGEVAAAAAAGVQPAAAAAVTAPPASTRVAAAEEPCDALCASWVRRNAVSAHLDVPYSAGVDVAAVAAVVVAAAEATAKGPGAGAGTAH